ncbi:class I lanthipeptide [Dinghuibacter silviterrae]|uniref:Uncharacterized protein n=1 Tax=Dinghuibacter silviterrae TaxID=1539049 RepID=A0A4R8DMM2_9BACT|nr:hypothetical protein EDB95_0004 [Dinghuibacter silviterrae]
MKKIALDSKKLKLKKELISKLTDTQLRQIKGGAEPTSNLPGCITYTCKPTTQA